MIACEMQWKLQVAHIRVRLRCFSLFCHLFYLLYSSAPIPDIYYFQNTLEVTSVQLILSFSLTVSLTIFVQSPWSRLCCIRLFKFVIFKLHYILRRVNLIFKLICGYGWKYVSVFVTPQLFCVVYTRACRLERQQRRCNVIRRMAGLIVSRTTYSAVRNSIYTVNTHPPLGGISALDARRSKHVDIGYYRETAAASIKLR